MKQQIRLSDHFTYRKLLQFVFPSIVMMIFTSIYGVVDGLFVSNFAGKTAFAAINLVMPFIMVLGGIGFMIGTGGTALVSKTLGEGRQEEANRYFSMMILFTALLGVLLSVTGVVFMRPVALFLGATPEMLEDCVRYGRIVNAFTAAFMLQNVFQSFLIAAEKPKLGLAATVAAGVTNMVLDAVLVSLLPQDEKLAGAALATCISSWLGPILILIFSAFEKNMLIGPVRELFAFSWKQLGEFCTRALPVMSNEGLWALGMITLNRVYANMGYEYYAGMTIFKTFSELAFAFFVGLGNACVIMVGKSIGSGKIRRGVADARRFSVLVPLMGLVVGLSMIAARHPLVSLFAMGDNLSPTTISTAYAVTIFCSLEYCFRNISYVQVVGVFRSGGDTLMGMFCDLVSLWLVAIPLALLGARVLHVSFLGVVMLAYLGEDIPKSILCMLHFKSMRWLKPVTAEGQAGLEEYRSAE